MTIAASAVAQPWVADRGDGTYRNPILFADYSDPDVVRVGDDYWMTASSFSHVPALPILHSRDLVNWTLVNHALPALVPIEHFRVPRHGGGVWAPTIRHHAGKFWIYYPDPDFGIYVLTATDPRGRWSEPVMVKAGKGLIDPAPLWDDNGKAYLVHGWARSRSGKANLLTLNELSTDGTRVLDGEGTVIIDENTTGRGLRTLEGPKFFKRDGMYWIFAPVNGVATGEQAVYRAKDIRGPYDIRIVLEKGTTEINGPHQGAWIDTPGGEHWFIHFQDRGAYGRITHLQPMAWRSDGWPTMGTGVANNAAKGEPVLTHKKPTLPRQSVAAPATSDEFNAAQLGHQWQWQANPHAEWISLTARRGTLRLTPVRAPSNHSLYDAPNLLMQKFPAPAFTATTLLDFSTGRENEEAGLIVFGYSYAWIGLRRDAGGARLVQVMHPQADKESNDRVAASIDAPGQRVFLRVSVTADARCRFAYSMDGTSFTPFGEELQATQGRWVGAKVGIFAATRKGPERQPGTGRADFDWFRVTP